jgi:hypothetical protein
LDSQHWKLSNLSTVNNPSYFEATRTHCILLLPVAAVHDGSIGFSARSFLYSLANSNANTPLATPATNAAMRLLEKQEC